MAALIHSLDNYTPSQIGENGHLEYAWSHSIKEQIVQFHFQLVRTKDMTNLEAKLTSLLTELFNKLEKSKDAEVVQYIFLLFRIIGQTRDIVDGKGECSLTYMMIYVWNKFSRPFAEYAMNLLVNEVVNEVVEPDVNELTEIINEEKVATNKKVVPIGSWKDIKYLCNYCKEKDGHSDSNLISHGIQMVNDQLRLDVATIKNEKGNGKVSLVAKWIPREKSSFGWLFSRCATQYFLQYTRTAVTDAQKTRATVKCLMDYRKLLSSLNRHLDTVQIKQCGRNWAGIDFTKTTSVTLANQTKAFLNLTKQNTVRHPDCADRIECAEHFKSHIEKAVHGEVVMKGKAVSMVTFVDKAIHANSQLEQDVINTQWIDNAKQTGNLGKMIAMVDVSGSMAGDPMSAAIGLGIRIAEKSVLGNRIMTFSNNPSWVNLDAHPHFVDRVSIVRRCDWGTNTNFRKALGLILDAIVQNKLQASEVEDMVLVILSDMQMDQGDGCNKTVLYEHMKTKYAEAGIKVCGTAYNPPHILFWNLRCTGGFPSLSSQPNTSMMSGFSPALLNLFCEKGFESLQTCTPWQLMCDGLDNPRYGNLSTMLPILEMK
jgi:hypothetical protein